MNTSSDFNSTPKTIDQSKYMESLMDFSTPMSTVSNRWTNNLSRKNANESDGKLSPDTANDSTIINETYIDLNNNNNTAHSNETILDKLLQKFHEHHTNFSHTQNYLGLLDHHLCEITAVLNQLQTSLEHHSSLKTTSEQLESRVLQMSIKQEQIRTAIDRFHQSPVINQTVNDMIQQISPCLSKTTTTATDPVLYYTELINAVKASLYQKTNLIDRIRYEQNHRKHRTDDYQLKIKHRQQLLLRLVEKLKEQQKTNEEYIERIHIDKPQFEHHAEHLIELQKLTEEYHHLQEENRSLKHQAKENIKALYTFINQTIE